jgi:hypothetical protein
MKPQILQESYTKVSVLSESILRLKQASVRPTKSSGRQEKGQKYTNFRA